MRHKTGDERHTPVPCLPQMSSKMRIIRDRNYEFNTFCLFSFELIRERLGR